MGVYNQTKTMKKGRQYWTDIGKVFCRVVIVKIFNHPRRGIGLHGGRPNKRLAQVRRVGSKKVLPKLRKISELWVRE